MDSTGEFNPLEVIRTLTFIVLSGNAKYLICKKCKGKLKTLKNHRENVCKAEEELRCMHRSINQEDESASNRLATSTSVCGPETSTTVYTSPGKRTLATELSEESMNENKKTKLSAQSYSPKAVQTNLTFNVDKSASVACFIHVCWPSCDRSRKLQDDLVKIGVSLLRGTYKEIALSLWKHPEIRNNLIALLLKEVNKECESMCRDRIPQPVSPLEIHKREPKDKKRDRLNMFDARSILKKQQSKICCYFLLRNLTVKCKKVGHCFDLFWWQHAAEEVMRVSKICTGRLLFVQQDQYVWKIDHREWLLCSYTSPWLSIILHIR